MTPAAVRDVDGPAPTRDGDAVVVQRAGDVLDVVQAGAQPDHRQVLAVGVHLLDAPVARENGHVEVHLRHPRRPRLDRDAGEAE